MIVIVKNTPTHYVKQGIREVSHDGAFVFRFLKTVMMFGFWFVCSAIANFLGGYTGSYIDQISESYGLSVFFLIFTVIPIAAGLLMVVLKPMLIKKMHGIE